MTRKLVIICGPTATGKTALGIKLAHIFEGEIVSADSRQVYTGMDIGTGKDMPKNSKVICPQSLRSRRCRRESQNSKLQLKSQKYTVGHRFVQGIPVWLTDICRPDQEFSAAHFVEFALKVIEDIWQRGKLPILVGGTGLYIRSLLEPIDTAGIAPDWELRSRLASWSVSRLQKKLKSLDSSRFLKMNQSDRSNPRRLVRAIEIAKSQKSPARNRYAQGVAGGKVKSQNYNLKVKSFLLLGLKTRIYEALYERIDKRVEERAKLDAEQEARELFGRYSFNNSVLATTIGYRQWLAYFKGAISREETIKRWRFAEHAYARRQMTWFKKQPGIRWFKVDDRRFPRNVVKVVKEWYSRPIA